MAVESICDKTRKLPSWFARDFELVWPTKNGHSISVTQFSSLITYISSLITQIFTSICLHLPISIAQYFSHYSWTPTTVTVRLFCFVTRVPFFPSVFLFFSFPLPLQPCLSPKAETQTQKNVSTSLASSVPSSPVNNAQDSDVYNGAISPS